ncbi:MAG: hypothetical protein Q9160_004865 [Pyrenula sp. 1 TL-2023]
MRGATRASKAGAGAQYNSKSSAPDKNVANTSKKRKTQDLTKDEQPPKKKISKSAKSESQARPTKDNASRTKASPSKKVKSENDAHPSETQNNDGGKPKKGSNSSSPKKSLADSKLAKYATYSTSSPFPKFSHPTSDECHLAHNILTKLHGQRERPKEVKASATTAGCGDSPSVLDALVRTILSQNTSGGNSTRAKRSMDKVYGRSDAWEKIVEGGIDKLEDAIRCGGLANVKSKVIMSILEQVHEKHGSYSLDHLHKVPSADDAMKEMLSFKGVGPKTASCVVLFCLGRESFAVDTHVYRIVGFLGWRPKSADREETQAHLEVMVPGELKYPLHVLLVGHGKKCGECKAGGKIQKGEKRCPLRKAFDGKDGIKEEDMENELNGIKEEDLPDSENDKED